MLEDLGHTILVGDAAEIRRLARRRQKNDQRDADLILDLLVRGEFPRLYRYSSESREVLRQLRFRHRLVHLRTSIYNSLHALSISAGLSLQAKLATMQGRTQLLRLQLSPVLAEAARGVALVGRRVESTGLGGRSDGSSIRRAKMAHVRERGRIPEWDLLTALCLVHTLGDVSRFASTRKVTAYVGLDVVEHSSAERKVVWWNQQSRIKICCATCWSRQRRLLSEATNNSGAFTGG